MARFFLCLLAAACCCLALLVPPVQGRIGIGPADNGFSGARDGDQLHGESSAADRRTAAEEQRGTAATKKAKPVWSSSWTAATKKAKPAWSSSWTAAAGKLARPELRSVPGGPDPLHHHGSPWRPEPEESDAP